MKLKQGRFNSSEAQRQSQTSTDIFEKVKGNFMFKRLITRREQQKEKEMTRLHEEYRRKLIDLFT